MLNDSAVPRENVATLVRKWAMSVPIPAVLTSLALAYCLALRLLWISDVPFILDEPQLFAKAMQANADGGWAERGLQGSQGVHYGALPTWIYQVMLRTFTSPIEVAFAKAFLITLLTFGCLWVWAKHLRGVQRGMLAIAFLSPCLWFYARDLWDNSWAIPFSMVLWTSYLYFDDKPALRRLIVPAVSTASLILIHLMSLPLIGAIGIHFVVKHRAWILRRWAGVAALALLVAAVDFQYVSQLLQLERAASPGGWSLRGLGFFLKAPTYFSGMDLTYLMGRAWMDIPAFPKAVQMGLRLAVGLSLLSYLFFAAGVVQAVRRGFWLVMKRSSPPIPVVASWVQVSDLVAVLAFALFIALSFAKGLSDHPHYFNAIWPALFYLIWRGASYIWNYRNEGMAPWVGPALVVVWVSATLLCLTGASLRAHLGNGTRSLHYGPTVGNLWSLSEELLKMPGAEIIPVAYHIRMFPHGLQTLVSLRLMNEKAPEPAVNPGRWLITYRDSKQTWNGLIVMERMDDKNNGLLPVPKENAKSVVK